MFPAKGNEHESKDLWSTLMKTTDDLVYAVISTFLG